MIKKNKGGLNETVDFKQKCFETVISYIGFRGRGLW